jgi:hypothetical protein
LTELQPFWLTPTERYLPKPTGIYGPTTVLVQIKTRFDADANNEQETQAKLIESEEQLRLEQAKLGGLQDQLDRLEKLLESSGNPK